MKEIHELVSDLLDEDFSFNSIVKVFSEYELHQIEEELFSNNKEKRKYWIEIIKKFILTKSKFSKNKNSLNNNFNSIGDTLKKENININSAKDISITLLEAQIEILKAKIQKHDWNLSLKRQLKDKEKILLEVKGSIKNKKNYKK